MKTQVRFFIFKERNVMFFFFSCGLKSNSLVQGLGNGSETKEAEIPLQKMLQRFMCELRSRYRAMGMEREGGWWIQEALEIGLTALVNQINVGGARNNNIAMPHLSSQLRIFSYGLLG